MEIDVLEPVQLGGITQWIRIRGTSAANPVLLLMQQGPGLPIINETRAWEQRLGLENDFTVVYWDQRGTGLSALPLSRRASRFEITPQLMVADTITLLELIRDRYGRKPFIAGFSFGATYAAQAAVLRPDLVAGIVATGMDIDVPLAEQHMYDWALATARQRGNQRAVGQLENIGPPPHLDARQFTTRARWITNFGGVTAGATWNSQARTLAASLLRSPDYTPAAALRTIRGVTSSQAALLPLLAHTDLITTLPALEVPIILAQGRLDQVTPGAVAQKFHDTLAAPAKQLIWFEHSAHTPQYDEPAKFRDVLLTLRAGDPAAT
ncbi:MAG TPA: alpha/beta hydrolase [Streptosporangiaceae bacterium]|jgi:pimeloyl-ACP methyl ester carboxylesterase